MTYRSRVADSGSFAGLIRVIFASPMIAEPNVLRHQTAGEEGFEPSIG